MKWLENYATANPVAYSILLVSLERSLGWVSRVSRFAEITASRHAFGRQISAGTMPAFRLLSR
jgi:hypothetical protein